ncbi:MAG TPA: NrtA/SsuA/CpmA family ABC transporter substrate-binding protein [Burkholderiales bacterium]|nr:NrtA/SsuA/CpmA family ABC transporter substrate-binding protein [Burkholderiales bacterium]
MKIKQLLPFVPVLVTAASAFAVSAMAADLNFGKPGDPINLVVGYQPYYTESWSGVVMRDKKFYEKYLPKGSTVDFQIGLQGAIIVNNMLAGKQYIGYYGDMPGIVSTTKQDVADIRLVAVVGMGWDQCNIFLVRTDAPKFASDQEAIKWLNGKRVAVPKGSCTDRFAQAVFKKSGIQPSEYLNQNIEVITSGFRAGKLDAAVIWEPTASRLIEEGLARRVATGVSVGENDAGFLGMRADLIKQRPDVVKAWLAAELDAQQYFLDPKNAMEVARMAKEQTTGFSEHELWMAAYGSYPKSGGGTPVRIILPYTFTPDAMELIKRAAAFLYEVKSINTPQVRPEAVMPEFTQAILKERGLKAPLGEIKGLPDSAYTGPK